MIDNEMVLKQKWREQVRAWFKQMVLSEYSDLFIENGYDRLDVIVELTDEELKQLGVKSGHVKVILKAIADYKAKDKQKQEMMVPSNVIQIQPVDAVQQQQQQQEQPIVAEAEIKEDKENIPKENEPGQEPVVEERK